MAEADTVYDENGKEEQQGTASEAIADINAYEKEYEKWQGRGKQIVKRYRDERSEASNLTVVSRKFNVLWSNTETLKPTLYARLPRIQVERRFKDADPVGRTACEIAERAGNYLLETSSFDHVQRLCVQDLLLPGRAVQWINYRAEMSDVEQPVDSADDEASPLEKVREMIEPIYVDWRDFGHSPKRTWQEVNRAWRIVYMTRQQLIGRFGKKKGAALPLDRKTGDSKEKQPDTLHDTSTIYEVWDKKARKTCWVHKSEKDYLDESGPPVELQDFWPFPRPVWATLTNDTLVPVPLYVLYQDQAAELDKLTNRIGRFTDGLKLAGVCDASVPELQRLLSPNGTPDNMLIPVANFGALQEKGGVAGAVELLPLDMIAATLLQLYQARDQVLNVIYQVTGIADIIRGASDPKETATAQSIKGQFASLRIKDTQAEIARFARDSARIMVEMAVEMYEPETLYEMVQAQQFCKPTQREQQQAQLLAKFDMPPQKPMEEFQTALRMLRDDKMRSFHIDIETDSTIAMNEQEDKQNVTEFMTAFGGFLGNFGKIVQEAPAFAPVVGEALLYATRRFKAGRQLESAIEKAVEQFVQQASQPKPPSPEIMKIQAEQQASQADNQRQQQKDAADIQTDREKAQLEAQTEAQRIAMEEKQNEAELMIKAKEIQLKELELALKQEELGLRKQEVGIKAQSDERNHERETAKLVSSGVTGLPKAPPHPLEKHLSSLAEQMAETSKHHADGNKALAQSMQALSKAMGAPRRLVKDAKTGEKRSEMVN